MRQQGEILEHHAHLVAADVDQLRIAGLEQVAAIEHDAAIARLDQPRQAAHQRRFAGARQAHDDEDLALVHRQVDVAHRPDQLQGSERVVVGPPALRRDEMIGALPIKLPELGAGELHPPVKRRGAGRRRPAPWSVTLTTPSRSPRCRRSISLPRPRSTCPRDRPGRTSCSAPWCRSDKTWPLYRRSAICP